MGILEWLDESDLVSDGPEIELEDDWDWLYDALDAAVDEYDRLYGDM
jgi:hypothetical protein